MALDGAYLACLREELQQALLDTKVDKVHQPSREELILSLRGRNGSFKLLFCTRANSARVNITTRTLENPPAPPMFCMLLRKHLVGGRLKQIRQNGWERALYFEFDCINELGDVVCLTLAIEIMGRYSTIMLINEEGLVIDAIKRVDWEMSSIRPILPGILYELPSIRPGSLDLSSVEPEDMAKAVCCAQEPTLAKALLTVSHGTSPLICRELAHYVGRGIELTPSACVGDYYDRLVFALRRVKTAVQTGKNRSPYMLMRRDRSPLDFSFMPITQYGLEAIGREESSFSELLDMFYEQRDATERMKQRSQDVLRVLVTTTERINRKLSHQREELASSAKREEKRLMGDLLNAHLYLAQKGDTSLAVTNYYEPDCPTVNIALDPLLTPAQNAQRYYKEYRKAQTAERVLTEQISAGEEELRYLDSVFDALSRAKTSLEVDELRYELQLGGYIRIGGKQKRSAPLAPLRFITDDGFLVLVWRNTVQNDQLTLKIAKNHDVWLHTKNIPGSHVIIVTNGENPPDKTIEQAAVLAAFHSKAAQSTPVPVEYTKVRYVHKPSGARPGKVIYDHYQTAYVSPSAEIVAKLRE